jgi:hypothetical protein
MVGVVFRLHCKPDQVEIEGLNHEGKDVETLLLYAVKPWMQAWLP